MILLFTSLIACDLAELISFSNSRVDEANSVATTEEKADVLGEDLSELEENSYSWID